MSSRDRTIERWTPRIGPAAATKVVTVNRWRLVLPLGGGLVVLSVILARLTGYFEVFLVVVALYVISWPVSAVGLHRARVAARAAADAYLRLRHDPKEPPPIENVVQFDAWRKLMVARMERQRRGGPTTD